MKNSILIFIGTFALLFFSELALGLGFAPSFSRLAWASVLGAALYSMMRDKFAFLLAFALLYLLGNVCVGIFGVFSHNLMSIKISLAFHTLLACFIIASVACVRFKRTLAVILGVIFFAPSVFYTLYLLSSGGAFGTEALLALLQTNEAEALGYIKEQFSLGVLAVIFALIISLFALAKVAKNLEFAKKNLGFYFALALFVLSSVMLAKKCVDNNIYSNLARNAAAFKTQLENYEKNAKARLESVKELSFGDENKTVLVIIGESASRAHMSVYGYERATTPFFSELNASKANALFFSSAYSAHTHTTQTLLYALTAKNQYNNVEQSTAISIIELARLAGYRTAWLSNQAKYGLWGSPLALLASEADFSLFLSENDKDEKPDMRLADVFKEYYESLDGGKNLIILHLAGSHVRYADRYPLGFGEFGIDRVGTYDNSIAYTDSVLKEIFSVAKADFVVYFSDHAESLDGSMHDSNAFKPEMTFIPLMVYASDENALNTLKAHKDSVWTNDLLFNLLCSLLGIQSNLDEPSNDISNKLYDSNATRFKTLYGAKNISDF